MKKFFYISLVLIVGISMTSSVNAQDTPKMRGILSKAAYGQKSGQLPSLLLESDDNKVTDNDLTLDQNSTVLLFKDFLTHFQYKNDPLGQNLATTVGDWELRPLSSDKDFSKHYKFGFVTSDSRMAFFSREPWPGEQGYWNKKTQRFDASDYCFNPTYYVVDQPVVLPKAAYKPTETVTSADGKTINNIYLINSNNNVGVSKVENTNTVTTTVNPWAPQPTQTAFVPNPDPQPVRYADYYQQPQVYSQPAIQAQVDLSWGNQSTYVQPRQRGYTRQVSYQSPRPDYRRYQQPQRGNGGGGNNHQGGGGPSNTGGPDQGAVGGSVGGGGPTGGTKGGGPSRGIVLQ